MKFFNSLGKKEEKRCYVLKGPATKQDEDKTKMS